MFVMMVVTAMYVACVVQLMHDTQLLMVSAKINVCAWHTNFLCIYIQTPDFKKHSGNATKYGTAQFKVYTRM